MAILALAAFNWLPIGLSRLLGMVGVSLPELNLLAEVFGLAGGVGMLVLAVVYVLAGFLAIPALEESFLGG